MKQYISTRDIRSNKPLCLQEFPLALPSGTPSGKGLYLTVYPSSRPNTDTMTIDLSEDSCALVLLTIAFFHTRKKLKLALNQTGYIFAFCHLNKYFGNKCYISKKKNYTWFYRNYHVAKAYSFSKNIPKTIGTYRKLSFYCPKVRETHFTSAKKSKSNHFHSLKAVWQKKTKIKNRF